MIKRLILPDAAERYEMGSSVLHKAHFTDGTTVNELQFEGDPESMLIVTDDRGYVYDTPGAHAYPFSERVARTAIEHFNETGELIS